VKLRALVTIHLPDGDKETIVEAGKLIPERLHPAVPKEWVGRIVGKEK